MKRRAALFVATIALLFVSCLPPTVEPPVPPDPPILTMRQKQFQWQKDRKAGSNVVDVDQPPSGQFYVGAE